MSKQMKLVISALFIVIILLAVAITRFYSDPKQSTSDTWTTSGDIQEISSDSDGNKIFRGDSGLYGIIDQSSRIIVADEWDLLEFTGNGKCTASKSVRGKKLSGCIDYEGNIVVPLIYKSISRHRAGNFTFYLAQAESDGSCVVYDDDFTPCLGRSWDSCSFDSGELTLTSGNGTYTYSVSDSGFSLRLARLADSALDAPFQVDISSRILLSKLNAAILEEMISDTGRYIEFAVTGNSDYLSGIRTSGAAVFTPLFSGENNIITKKLISVPDIYLYSVRTEDSIPHYAVSVTAEVEITSKRQDGSRETFSGQYKAVVEFRGSSEADLAAVSGAFVDEKPDYPQETSDSGTTENQ